MRIGISLNGEGRGHLTRISAIAQELKKRHEIIFWVPETRYSELSNLFPDTALNTIPAFELTYTERNQVDILKTGSNNFTNILGLSSVISDIRNQIDFFKPDIILSDFEPIVPGACKNMNIPVIQFNHPAVVLQDKTLDYDAFIAKFIAKRMCSVYDELIISSFYSGDIGPIIRKEIQNAVRKNEDFLLVYLRGKSQDRILKILDKYSNMKYKVFPNSSEDFVSSLASCRAVITNAGHQLLSEAAYLDKPLYMIPIERQYEQILNGKMMEKAGRGVVANYKNMDSKLIAFLRNITVYKKKNIESEMNFNFKDNTKEAVYLLENKFISLTKKRAS